jgi:hypothetical protein
MKGVTLLLHDKQSNKKDMYRHINTTVHIVIYSTFTGTDNNLAFVLTYKNGITVQSVKIIVFTSWGKNIYVVLMTSKVSLLFFLHVRVLLSTSEPILAVEDHIIRRPGLLLKAHLPRHKENKLNCNKCFRVNCKNRSCICLLLTPAQKKASCETTTLVNDFLHNLYNTFSANNNLWLSRRWRG